MQHAPWLTPKKTPPFASFAPGSACAVPPRARAHLPAEVIAHDRPVPHRLEGAAVERAHARAPRLGRRRRERRRRHRSSPAARCRLPAEREKGGELLTRGRRPHSAGRRARRAPRTARQRAELCAAAPCKLPREPPGACAAAPRSLKTPRGSLKVWVWVGFTASKKVPVPLQVPSLVAPHFLHPTYW